MKIMHIRIRKEQYEMLNKLKRHCSAKSYAETIRTCIDVAYWVYEKKKSEKVIECAYSSNYANRKPFKIFARKY